MVRAPSVTVDERLSFLFRANPIKAHGIGGRSIEQHFDLTGTDDGRGKRKPIGCPQVFDKFDGIFHSIESREGYGAD